MLMTFSLTFDPSLRDRSKPTKFQAIHCFASYSSSPLFRPLIDANKGMNAVVERIFKILIEVNAVP